MIMMNDNDGHDNHVEIRVRGYFQRSKKGGNEKKQKDKG